MANPHPILVVGRTRQEAQDHITTHNLPRPTIAAGTRNITQRIRGLHVSEVRLLKTALDHLHTADLHHLRMIEARGKTHEH